MSQDALADKMRDYGHAWTQTTVYNVEKGVRQLRVSEAVDLMLALGKEAGDISLLVEDAWSLEIDSRLHDIDEARRQLNAARTKLRLARKKLAKTVKGNVDPDSELFHQAKTVLESTREEVATPGGDAMSELLDRQIFGIDPVEYLTAPEGTEFGGEIETDDGDD